MFNLLPQSEAQEIRREYRLRLLLVVLVFILGTTLIAGVALVPSLILSSAKEQTAEKTGMSAEPSGVPDKANLLSTLAITREKLSLLGGAGDRPAGALISLVLRDKPDSISLNGISIKKSDDGSRAVTLSGVAPSREILVSFKSALEKEKIVKAVDLPISTFAASANIDFSLFVSVAKQSL